MSIIAYPSRRPLILRDAEFGLFTAWMNQLAPPTTVFSICGYGGVGKTSLMSQMAQSAREAGHIVIWVEGRSCEKTPAGFLSSIQTATSLASASASTASASASAPFALQSIALKPYQRMVICIDDFEALTGIEGWILEDFLYRLPPHTLLVVASRAGLSTRWMLHPTMSGWVTEMRLSNFTRPQATEYLKHFKDIDAGILDDLVRLTKGHPLSLALASYHLYLSLPRDEIESAIAQAVSGNLLRELVAPSFRFAIEVLSILGSADYNTLSACLDMPFTIDDYYDLANLSFVRFTSGGLTLHDLARVHLLMDLRIRTPQQFDWMRQKLFDYLYKTLRTARQDVRRQIAAQLLNLCLDSWAFRTVYADLNVNPKSYQIESLDPRDRLQLHNILADWCSYSVDPARPHRVKLYHDFLDDVLELYPETVRVVRTTQGSTMAMMILFLVYDETYDFLSQYFADELEACGGREELGCKADEADTYYAVLGAYDKDCSDYSGEELVGACTRDVLGELGYNTRFVLVANNPDLKLLLTRIGFDMKPTKDGACSTAIHEADVLTLDLRKGNFLKWITRFVQPQEFEEYDEAATPVTFTSQNLRDALKMMNDPARLGKSELAARLSMSGFELQGHLKQVIIDICSSQQIPIEQQNVLYGTYGDTYRTAINAALHCNMSRATYYRHLNAAIECVADFMKQITS
jgi:hypothetical protein